MSEAVLTAKADVQQRNDKHVPGEPGLWLFLFGDMLVFTFLFVVFLTRRSANGDIWADSQEQLDRNFGAINTIVLLTSSLIVVCAVVASRSAAYGDIARPLLFAGFAVGSCFVVIKVVEYHEMVSAGATPMTNEFFMYYYALTGLHLVHVLIGLGVLFALATASRSGPRSAASVTYLEAGTCFWHMVDLLWIFIFPLVFLVR